LRFEALDLPLNLPENTLGIVINSTSALAENVTSNDVKNLSNNSTGNESVANGSNVTSIATVASSDAEVNATEQQTVNGTEETTLNVTEQATENATAKTDLNVTGNVTENVAENATVSGTDATQEEVDELLENDSEVLNATDTNVTGKMYDATLEKLLDEPNKMAETENGVLNKSNATHGGEVSQNISGVIMKELSNQSDTRRPHNASAEEETTNKTAAGATALPPSISQPTGKNESGKGASSVMNTTKEKMPAETGTHGEKKVNEKENKSSVIDAPSTPPAGAGSEDLPPPPPVEAATLPPKAPVPVGHSPAPVPLPMKDDKEVEHSPAPVPVPSPPPVGEKPKEDDANAPDLTTAAEQKKKWEQRVAMGANGKNDLSGGTATIGQNGKAIDAIGQDSCQVGAACVALHGRGETVCDASGGGTCVATSCDVGYVVDTSTKTCGTSSSALSSTAATAARAKDCRESPVVGDVHCDVIKDGIVTGQGKLICDRGSGETSCIMDAPVFGDRASVDDVQDSGSFGFLGMLFLGGVLGAMFYLKGYLPPQVQAYLGGAVSKMQGGTAYEMVSMVPDNEGLSVEDAPIDSSDSYRMKAPPSPRRGGGFASPSAIAQEGDWDDDDGFDDGWGDGDGWGDEGMDDVPLSNSAKVLPRSAEEKKASDRYNRNR